MDVTEGVGDGVEVEEKIKLGLFILKTDLDAASNSFLLTSFAFVLLSRMSFLDDENIRTNFLDDRKSPTAEIPNQNPMDDAMSVKH